MIKKGKKITRREFIKGAIGVILVRDFDKSIKKTIINASIKPDINSKAYLALINNKNKIRTEFNKIKEQKNLLERLYLKESKEKKFLLALTYLIGKTLNVEPALIAAIIQQESKFEANKIGKKQEVGLMQLLPSTEKDIQERLMKNYRALFNKPKTYGKALFDPLYNIFLGTIYLKALYFSNEIQKEENKIIKAIKAYHVGLSKLQKNPNIAEKYIEKISNYYIIFLNYFEKNKEEIENLIKEKLLKNA